MFKKSRKPTPLLRDDSIERTHDGEIGSAVETPEWEEYILPDSEPHRATESDGNNLPEYVLHHSDEPAKQSNDAARAFYADVNTGRDALEHLSEDDIRAGTIDAAAFPAIRLAYGLDDDVAPADGIYPEEDILTAELNEDEWRMELIRHYAEMDEEENADNSPQQPAEEENLPELFRIPSEHEQLPGNIEENGGTQPDEFTMESEIELQRAISGELFSYIDTIEQDSRSLIRRREQERAASAQPKKLDPYNLHFNSRFDDLDEVLSNTPEISLVPKIKMEE